MVKKGVVSLLLTVIPVCLFGQKQYAQDVVSTPEGDLEITFIGHGTLMFEYQGTIIHVDPVSQYGDYSALPGADIILITHGHGDHFDPAVINKLRSQETVVIVAGVLAGKLDQAVVMSNGDSQDVKGLTVEAVPAYNLVHMRSAGQPYHPRGEGNGYVISFGSARVYVAGDTENTPEMKSLENIDIAFLPMNLPYTMTPEMVADAARAFRPGILYPYHYGDTDPEKLVSLLSGEEDIDIRIRPMR
ncbi:MAG TPA: MBL fold metallo-hydrolase [bacterium]|nr:MBL fold metallo-hydrolase [bacterium]